MGRPQVFKFGCKRRNQKKAKRAGAISKKTSIFLDEPTTDVADVNGAIWPPSEPQSPLKHHMGRTTLTLEPAVTMRGHKPTGIAFWFLLFQLSACELLVDRLLIKRRSRVLRRRTRQAALDKPGVHDGQL